MVDLVTTLKNYGPNATDVTAELTTDDPFIVIHSGVADFGDILAGRTASNDAEPFVIQTASNVPLGHIARFTLTAADSHGQTVSEFCLPIGKRDYLVWDASPDRSSGPAIDTALRELGYSGGATADLFAADPTRYHVLFVSVGIYISNYVIGNGSAEATALVAHINSGGGMYLEGGDVWYYDPSFGGHDFRPAFGISSYDDGSADLHTVTGRAGTLTEGMVFPYVGENSYIDRLNAAGTGQLIMTNDSPYYGCAVLNDTGTYRTIGASFEFAGLFDGIEPSTKLTLAQAYMSFFLPTDPQAVPDAGTAGLVLLPLRPNPLRGASTLEFIVPQTAAVRIDLIDAAGRCVRNLTAGERAAGRHRLEIDGRELDTGIYFIRSRVADQTHARRCVVIR